MFSHNEHNATQRILQSSRILDIEIDTVRFKVILFEKYKQTKTLRIFFYFKEII